MKITEDYAEGYSLQGVKYLNNGMEEIVSLSPNQMWSIYEYMKLKNIKQQIESYIELRKNDKDFFETWGQTGDDLLKDDELLNLCVDDVNDGSYGDLEEEEIYALLERYV